MSMRVLRNFFDELRFHIDDRNLAVRAEQLRTRLRLYPSMLAVQMMIEPFFVWLMWEIADQRHLLLWMACAYL